MKTENRPARKAAIPPARRFKQIVEVLHRYHALEAMTPDKLRQILEDLGPTYVKLGQIMSSRADLIGADYAKALQVLRSSVEPMDWSTVAAELRVAYGQDPDLVFASIDHTPLGSASMAQVHRAVLKDGRDVVVKVQRPGLYEQMDVDVRMMKKAARLIALDRTVSSVVDLDEMIDEFWTSAKQEMDFTIEAANARRFSENQKDVRYIKAPWIETDLSRKNILVMEEIVGVPIDDYPALSKAGYSRKEIAMKTGVSFLKQVLEDGFFHADPHSGNLMIDGGQIAWIDFGMMGEITKGQSAAMTSCLQAISSRDLTLLTDSVLSIGIPPDDLDYIGFSNALEHYLNRYLQQSFESLDLAAMVSEAVEICHSYGVRLPKGITLLARSLVTLQGTLKDLDSSVSMMEYISATSPGLAGMDWNREIRRMLKDAWQSGQALLTMAPKASHILSLAERGQLQVGVKLADLKTLMPEINRLVDRVVIALLIAALLVGSSIVCTTEMKPKFLDIPLLGFAGFFVSFCLSIWLFYKMLFHPKKGNGLF